MLNLPPRDKTPPKIQPYPGKAPKPEEIVILSRPLLSAVMKLEETLAGAVGAKWALGGEAGEIMQGVNVTADRLVINTTKEGCERIWEASEEYRTLAPALVEKKLAREADVDGRMLPVYVRSNYAELTIDGTKVEVYGDQQFKVGEWDWGDPLDFEPTTTYIPGGRTLPLVPLNLQAQLALGLGWLDIVELISDAVLSKHHVISHGPEK
jgi:hypothetical protein